MMNGPVYAARTVCLSMLVGSMFLWLYHNARGGALNPYQGNDAILRGLIFTIIFQNPAQSLQLFPIPVYIPAWGIGGFLLFMDLLFMNVAGLGGTTASYAMINWLV